MAFLAREGVNMKVRKRHSFLLKDMNTCKKVVKMLRPALNKDLRGDWTR